jgi:hypothetical protein
LFVTNASRIPCSRAAASAPAAPPSAAGNGRGQGPSAAAARRAAAFAQPPAPLRNTVTNQAVDAESVHRRPAIQDGRPMTRAERNRQEEQAKRLRKRALKRNRPRGA